MLDHYLWWSSHFLCARRSLQACTTASCLRWSLWLGLHPMRDVSERQGLREAIGLRSRWEMDEDMCTRTEPGPPSKPGEPPESFRMVSFGKVPGPDVRGPGVRASTHIFVHLPQTPQEAAMHYATFGVCTVAAGANPCNLKRHTESKIHMTAMRLWLYGEEVACSSIARPIAGPFS